jgi:mRNA-degrading endonuclease toxin of MazEF toxin-antitoxin module
MTTTLTDKQLAEIIGKDYSNNGRLYWNSSDLSSVIIALRALKSSTTDDSFLVDGSMPYWLYLGVAAALAPKTAYLNTPNFGPIFIPSNTPDGSGSGLTFSTYEDANYTLVQFSCPRYLQPHQMTEVIPPVVNPRKGVVISSGAPPWIIATVGMAYAKHALWVACTQKIGNPVIAISAAPLMLGVELDRDSIERLVEKAALKAVPKRGEVWLFDDGYGDHPGIILSPEDRNGSCDDVLLVPLTTSPRQAARHLLVLKADTGLASDSFAQCTNISRIGKECLIRGPISVVTPALIGVVMTNVRRALGEVA